MKMECNNSIQYFSVLPFFEDDKYILNYSGCSRKNISIKKLIVSVTSVVDYWF